MLWRGSHSVDSAEASAWRQGAGNDCSLVNWMLAGEKDTLTIHGPSVQVWTHNHWLHCFGMDFIVLRPDACNNLRLGSTTPECKLRRCASVRPNFTGKHLRNGRRPNWSFGLGSPHYAHSGGFILEARDIVRHGRAILIRQRRSRRFSAHHNGEGICGPNVLWGSASR